MINKLLEQGHEIIVATRGKTPDSYGDRVNHIVIQRTNEESMREALQESTLMWLLIRLHTVPMI